MSIRQSAGVIVAVCGLAAVSATHAGVITFTFTPPASGGTLTNVANGASVNTGLMAFDQNAALNFTIDGTEEGFGVVNYPNARMEMLMTLSPAVDLGEGLFRASVTGTFTIYDYSGNVRNDLLIGTVSGGSFLRFGSTHTILLNSNLGFAYSAGPGLAALLPAGRTLSGAQDAAFALTNVQTFDGNPDVIGAGGVFESFTANTAFTGSSSVIPTPGTIVLGMCGGILALRRRR